MLVRIVAVGAVERGTLDYVAGAVAEELSCDVVVDGEAMKGEAFHNSERQQSHSSEMLAALPRDDHHALVLGITPADLYIPILTFVFGEATVGGDRAVVSTYRLRQEAYGLPTDEALFLERLVKEAVHEIGHVFGLVHCEHYDCVMARSHEVESIDLKMSSFCGWCRQHLEVAVRERDAQYA